MRPHLLAALLLVGCGSSVTTEDTNTDGGTSAETGGVTREQACAAGVEAICSQYQRCMPLLIEIGFGDEKACTDRLKASCVAGFDAPGTSSTPAHLDACAASLAKIASCELLGQSTPECTPAPGALENGAGCADDAQCKSTWCAKNDEQVCGKCAALTNAGDKCVDTGKKADGTSDDKCSRGLTCNASGVCVKPGAKGESCSDAQPCALSLACFGGKCVDAGRAGAKCDPAGTTDPPCDLLQGVYCAPADKVCKLFGLAKAGESCGLVGGEYKLCTAGAKCSADGLATGTCVAPAKDGAACDLEKKVGCLGPAQCIGGTCTLPDPKACK